MGEAVTEAEAEAKVERAGDVELLVFSFSPWLLLVLSLSVLLTVVRAGGSVAGRREEVIGDWPVHWSGRESFMVLVCCWFGCGTSVEANMEMEQ